MVSTVFSDDIVRATDLRTKQREWLERAYEKPITVSYGKKQLAIMRREQVGRLVTTNYYLELVIKACNEFEKEGESKTFPWTESLSEGDRLQFHKELLTNALKSTVTGDWAQLEYLIQDWKATAEVESDPELAKALMEKGDPKAYVRLKG